MLTATELASMRVIATSALPDTAVVSSGTFVSDSGGGGSIAYVPSGTVDCRIAPVAVAEGERTSGGRISADAEYVVTLPFDVEITTDSQLEIDGETYHVELIRDRSWNLSTRVEVQKVV